MAVLNKITSFIINGEIVTIDTYLTLITNTKTLSSGSRTLTTTGYSVVGLTWNLGWAIQGDNTYIILNNTSVWTNYTRVATNKYRIPKGATSVVFYYRGTGVALTASSTAFSATISDVYYTTVVV